MTAEARRIRGRRRSGGTSWENTDSGFRKHGVAVGSSRLDAAELGTVLTVFELSLDQAFPPSSSQPNDQSQPGEQLQLTDPIHPNACIQVPCQRPLHRCMANCTGFVCSQTDGTEGICIHEG